MAELGLRRIIGPPKPVAAVPPPAPIEAPTPAGSMAGYLSAPRLRPAVDAVVAEATKPDTSMLQRAVNILSLPFQQQAPPSMAGINAAPVQGLRRSTLRPPTQIIGVRG